MSYVIRDASYALQERPPREWLVDDLIRKSSIFGMYGKSGEGKTYVALTLAVAIAAGKPWMDLNIRQGTSLFVNTQMEEIDFADRVGEVLRGAEVGEECPIKFVTIYDLVLGGKEDGKQAEKGFGELQKMYDEVKPTVIFIDAYLDIIGNEGMKSSDVQPFFRRLREFRGKNNGVTIGFIHHKNKNGGSYGSVDIENQVDNYLTYNGPKAIFEITSDKARFNQEVKIVGKKIWEPGIFRVETCIGDGDLTSNEKIIVDILYECGETERNVLIEAASKKLKISSKTIGNILAGLSSKGKIIETTGNVNGGRGRTTAYKAVYRNICDLIKEAAQNAPEIR